MLPYVLTLIRTVVLGSRVNTNRVGSHLQLFYHNYIYKISSQVEMNLEKRYLPSRDIRDTLHFNGTWLQYKRNNFIKRIHPNVIIQYAIVIHPTIPFFRNWSQKKKIRKGTNVCSQKILVCALKFIVFLGCKIAEHFCPLFHGLKPDKETRFQGIRTWYRWVLLSWAFSQKSIILSEEGNL